MSRSLTVAGVERWDDYERDSLQIDKGLTYDADSCRFQLRGAAPSVGDEVIITDTELDSDPIYAGVIIKVDYVILPNKSVCWAIECDDYSCQLSRRLVVEVYESMTAQAIIEDIITKYIDAGYTSSIGAGSPTIEKIVFDYVPVAEAFKKLCDYIGWSWTVSTTKVITFFNPAVLLTPAPLVVIPGATFTNMKYNVDMSNVRNLVYVRGGKMPSSTQVYEWKADGVARLWPLPFDINTVDTSAFTVAGVAKTIGEEGVDAEGTKNFYYHKKEKRLKCDDSTTTPTAGVTMHMEYTELVDVITISEDLTSQAAIAAVQGNDGIYEHTISDTSLVTLEAAEAAGDADIRENGNPKTTGSFDTVVTGWAPGQIVTIALPLRGINASFMVQRVSMKPRPISGWNTTVNFGGRLLGVADYLKALINDQKGETATTNAIMKYTRGLETVAITDELTTTAITHPFLIEASAVGRATTA